MKHIFDSKDEKLTEKAFIQSVVISVVGILLCIVALCSATFCWFTGGTENNSNTLVSGSFDVTITVAEGNMLDHTITEGNGLTDIEAAGEQADAAAHGENEAENGGQAEDVVWIAVNPAPDDAGVFICDLPGAGTYTVTLTLKEGSTVKGHCLVTVGEDAVKHTAAIIGDNTTNREGEENTNPFIFTVTVQDATRVSFEPRWGVVVQPDIAHKSACPAPAVNDMQGETPDTGE